MPSVTFAQELVTTIPSSATSNGTSKAPTGDEEQQEEELVAEVSSNDDKKSSLWRLVLIIFLFCGAIIVGILLWSQDRIGGRSDSEGNGPPSTTTPTDSPGEDNGLFENPATVTWKTQALLPMRNANFSEIALCGDGRTLVIANTSLLQIYRLLPSNETVPDWREVSNFPIPGNDVHALSLSGDGRRLAYATASDNRVRFLEYLKESRWALRPEYLGAKEHTFMSLDYSGETLCLGQPTVTQTWRWSSGMSRWSMESATLPAAAGVRLSADGQNLAIVDRRSLDILTYIRFFDGTWTIKGPALSIEMPSTLDGNDSDDNMGPSAAISVDLSADGNVLAVGSPGLVQVYYYIRGTWQIRQPPVPLSSNQSSNPLCVNDEGNILATVDGELLRVFQATEDSWTPVGAPIDTVDGVSWDYLQCSSNGRGLVTGSRKAEVARILQAVAEPPA